MPDTTVCMYSSSDSGAPALNGLAGSLVAVLDAALVHGYGSVTVSSLSVAGGVATCMVAAGHGMTEIASNAAAVGVVVEVSGVTGALSALNARFRATVVSATTLTWAVAGIANGTASGTIACKRAPAGWTKAFSGANLAAYVSGNAFSSLCYVRLDDSGGTADTGRAARLVGYESMTGIDTGSGRFPTETQEASPGPRIVKSNAASSASRGWYVFADDRTAHILVAPESAASPSAYYSYTHFGDIHPFAQLSKPFMLAACRAGRTGYFNYYETPYERIPPGTYSARYAPRGYSTGTPVLIYFPDLTSAPPYIGNRTLDYPCPTDGGTWAMPLLVGEGLALPTGKIRGMYEPWHTPATQPIFGTIQGALDAVSNGPLFWARMQRGGAGMYFDVLVDLWGPW